METILPYIAPVLEGLQHNFVLIILSVLLVVNIIYSALLSRRIRTLASGGDGASLEGTIQGLDKRATRLEHTERERARALADIERRLVRSVQGLSLHRFDPFQNASGQQSFSTALVSEKGDGVVISGIHARDGVRVYAKEVRGFSSDRELSEEESSAIEKAKKDLSQ